MQAKHFCDIISERQRTEQLTHSAVGLLSLDLRESLQSLGLTAHATLNLDDLFVTAALLTVDAVLGVVTLGLDSVTDRGELGFGVLRAAEPPAAASTFDPAIALAFMGLGISCWAG
jgi:hypothetical protein